MSLPRNMLSSEFVHVTTRGIGRRMVFEDDIDKRKFLDTLHRKLDDSDAVVLAWCLMVNHIHLLFRAQHEELSTLMQRTLISYAQFFNGRHGHVGKVFQNRFSSTSINTEAHLIDAVRYVHFNALDAGLPQPRDYPWSSYREIACEGNTWEGEGLCDKRFVLSLFGSREAFIQSHDAKRETVGMEWLAYKPRLDDREASSIAERLYGKNYSEELASMEKAIRDKELRKLKKHGLSIRQIERLTGIGRGIIAKA